MTFEELEKDKAYRVVIGNDTMRVGDIVWVDTLNKKPHLNILPDAACLDEDDILSGALEGVRFEPESGWIVETKAGLGGYSRAQRIS